MKSKIYLQKYRWLLLFAPFLVYLVIVKSINQGISCDEGFYLLGYLKNQNLGDNIYDFHNIVRSLFFFMPDDNVLLFRILRFVLNFGALVLFACSSYKWLKMKYDSNIEPVTFFTIVMLLGAMSFSYASPTISFDHIQQIIYLICGSLLFLSLSANKIWKIEVFSFLLGFLFVFGLTNYLPSGILLILLIVIVFRIEQKISFFLSLLFIIIGFTLGCIYYHNYVNDLTDYLISASNYLRIELTGFAKHDSGSLVKEMTIAILELSCFYIPIIFLLWKNKFSLKINILSYGIMALVLCFFLFYRKIYDLHALILFLPISIIFSYTLKLQSGQLLVFFKSKLFWLVILFSLFPFFGIFGTNQPIFMKSIIFLPYWVIPFFILSGSLDSHYLKIRYFSIFLFVTMLFAGYFYIGNFKRYQYYYSPRSSVYPMQNNERYKYITVSKYQQEYYSNLMNTLKMLGFKKNDNIVGFGEHQIAIYMVGGYFYGDLVYYWNQYVEQPKQPAKYILLFKKEVPDFMRILANSGWDFPDSYNKIEMQRMSENMSSDEYNTIIYYLK